MLTQSIKFDVLGPLALSHTTNWNEDLDAPSCSVELPKTAAFAFEVVSLGRISIEGDLEVDAAATAGDRRVFRWTAAAQAAGTGSASITLSHPNDDFYDVDISLEMSDAVGLQVEDGEEPEPEEEPRSFSPGLLGQIEAYGAYTVGFLGALGALVFALFMPAHRMELVSASGAMVWGAFFFSSVGDRFGLRILAFLAAAVALGFTFVMPENTNQLIEGAGVLAALGIYFGDNWK